MKEYLILETTVYKIVGNDADREMLAEAGRLLREGALVAFPTETVYGLGASALSTDAAAKIYEAKGRPSDNPLIVHVCEPADAEALAYTTPLYYALAERFMPGPLTVIMPKRELIPEAVTGGLDTVAVRCPTNEVARELIRASGVPVAAPSANLSGSPSPTKGEHVVADLYGRVDMIIDGGDCDIGLESTIIKLDGGKATLLRPGAITYDALTCVCESVEIAPAVSHALAENEKPLSPGMKYRHYAPNSPLVLIDGKDGAKLDFLRKAQKNENCAILCYDEECALLSDKNVLSIGKRSDLEHHARVIFSTLRNADKLGVDVIYGHLPVREGIGLALYNRMIRAAAHTIKEV